MAIEVEVIGGPDDGVIYAVPSYLDHLDFAISDFDPRRCFGDATTLAEGPSFHKVSLPIRQRRDGSLYVNWRES